MKRTALAVCLAAILLLALAVPAFAGSDGSSGTVYGKAVLAPYAITISGGGTDPGDPLTYEGNLGQFVWEKYGSQVTVQNSGTQDAELKIDVNELPHADSNIWNLSAMGGADTAIWTFWSPKTGGSEVMPSSDPWYAAYDVLDHNLLAGSSDSFESALQFPTSTGSTADHYMSATVSIVAP